MNATTHFDLVRDLTDAERQVFYWETGRTHKKTVVAVLLALFLGVFGLHRFYVGDHGIGFGFLGAFLLSFVTMPIGIGFLLLPLLGLAILFDCLLMQERVRKTNREDASRTYEAIVASRATAKKDNELNSETEPEVD